MVADIFWKPCPPLHPNYFGVASVLIAEEKGTPIFHDDVGTPKINEPEPFINKKFEGTIAKKR